jgi:hypothetical protein
VRRWHLSAAVLGTGLWLAAPASVHALTIIDEFDAPAGGIVLTDVGGGGSASALTADAGILGGWRLVELAVPNVSVGGGQANVFVNFEDGGNFQLASTLRADAVSTITYDANGAGLGANLSGETSFQLLGVESDLAVTYTITVVSSTGTASLALSTPAGFTGNLNFAFSSFVGSLNPASVSSIALEVDGVAAADALIEAFVAVPEPGTAAVLGLGLCGLAWMGRRRSGA